MVYSGFWAAEDEGTPDNMNALTLQRDVFANRPAAGKEGVVFIATDGIGGTGVAEAIYRDNSSTWDLIGIIPPTDSHHARIATGTYTGDAAASQAITGVGFTPKFLRISQQITSAGIGSDQNWTTNVIIDDIAGGTSLHPSGDDAHDTTKVDRIISLDADGFTVGDGTGFANETNASAVVYNYLAIG